MNYRTKYLLEASNMKKIKHAKKIIYTLAIILTASILFSQNIPQRPEPPRLVNDFTNTLSESEKTTLERKLIAFNDSTSNQIAVVLISSLGGQDPNHFAWEIGETWKVGQGKFNNGVVLLVRPKTGRSKGRAAIQVGYGLEGIIPDAIAKRIVENEMIPYFKEGRYYQGIDNATNVLMKLAAKEITKEQYKKQTGRSPFGVFVPFIAIIIVYLIIRILGRKSYTAGGRRGGSSGLWTALFLGSMMSGGRSHGGGWGNFSSGSGSFGGGGGFGGFGGGGFGGGGASGSW